MMMIFLVMASFDSPLTPVSLSGDGLSGSPSPSGPLVLQEVAHIVVIRQFDISEECTCDRRVINVIDRIPHEKLIQIRVEVVQLKRAILFNDFLNLVLNDPTRYGIAGRWMDCSGYRITA